MPYYLHIRSGGWQWRIDANAVVQLRHLLTSETVLEVPVALVVQALTHFVTGARLTTAFMGPVRATAGLQGPARPRDGLRRLGVPHVAVQETRRLARASRRRR